MTAGSSFEQEGIRWTKTIQVMRNDMVFRQAEVCKWDQHISSYFRIYQLMLDGFLALCGFAGPLREMAMADYLRKFYQENDTLNMGNLWQPARYRHYMMSLL